MLPFCPGIRPDSEPMQEQILNTFQGHLEFLTSVQMLLVTATAAGFFIVATEREGVAKKNRATPESGRKKTALRWFALPALLLASGLGLATWTMQGLVVAVQEDRGLTFVVDRTNWLFIVEILLTVIALAACPLVVRHAFFATEKRP